MHEETTASRWTCDGCGKVQITLDGEAPIGYHMEVFWTHLGGGDTADVFACKAACIKKAVIKGFE
jgi:hypothetical protein